jgi:2-polyprenyl-6-methoxyphenol hydroxylase-like FAD-dependent oxidoreductase
VHFGLKHCTICCECCRFVQKLRHRAAAHKTVCMRQGVATKLITKNGSEFNESRDDVVAGVLYKAQDGVLRKAFAHLTVACDGMYSMLRKRLHEDAGSVRCCPRLSVSMLAVTRRDELVLYDPARFALTRRPLAPFVVLLLMMLLAMLKCSQVQRAKF